jgi:hypothetical protein
MSKAVLVLENMPNSCDECPLKSPLRGLGITHCCNLTESIIHLEEGFEKRLDNCPLAELPAIKTPYGDVPGNNKFIRNLGYNECLREIERKVWKKKR